MRCSETPRAAPKTIATAVGVKGSSAGSRGQQGRDRVSGTGNPTLALPPEAPGRGRPAPQVKSQGHSRGEAVPAEPAVWWYACWKQRASRRTRYAELFVPCKFVILVKAD